jgi:hypothetical protein
MTLVDRAYNQALDEMSGAERLGRTLKLHTSIRDMLALQLMREFPDLSRQELAIRVARRIYLSDPQMQLLLDRVERNLG